MVLQNTQALTGEVHTLPGRLAHWAATRPGQTFLAEVKSGRSLTYAQAESRRTEIAAQLLNMGVSKERPLAVVAENGIDHGLMLLAATSVGLPVAVISPSYAAPGAAPWDKLRSVLKQVGAAVVLADDAEAVQEAAGDAVRVRPLRHLRWLDDIDPVSDAERLAAEGAIGADTVAKLLFTSGSTGTPKAVMQTQAMMATNMEGLSLAWPFLAARPPVLVDWLPWNHVFGGNFCFNIALYFGGTLHVDSGKPVPALIGETVEALRQVSPTLYFNVPMGYEMLFSALESDPQLAASFLGRLDCLFNAGAAMPASTRDKIERIAQQAIGKVPPIYGGWGSTETAPLSTIVHFPTTHAANLGVPLAGTSIKMVPDAGKWELRVKGPNVTPGYWGDPAATAGAFDEEGYFLIGDAGYLADPDDPSAGILFDGRVAENFKLSTGTWVNVDTLRLAIISACDGLISNAVIAGEGRDHLGALLFLSEAGQKAGDGIVRDRIARHNAQHKGASTRIARFLVLDVPPRAELGEVTEKGSLNQRRILDLRKDDVERLFAQGIEAAS
tara:strand:- start:16494 stop:18158 length:1665 start_codon:yes stop_codon:yes gene_type:complete